MLRVPSDKTKAPRCDGCALHLAHCLCADVPQLDTTTRVVLVINHRELRKTTNTGRLAARCLVGSELHVFGAKDVPLAPDAVAPPGAANLLLYPSPHAEPLTPAFCARLPEGVRLIVPDGDWGQAAKIARRLPAGRLVHVSLPEGPASPYVLRRPAHGLPQGVATIEAVARALDALEGAGTGAPLRAVFRLFIERTLQARGGLALLR